MENRSGLVVQGDLTRADGHAERRAALSMVHTTTRPLARLDPEADLGRRQGL
jgi:hypothetical protein